MPCGGIPGNIAPGDITPSGIIPGRGLPGLPALGDIMAGAGMTVGYMPGEGTPGEPGCEPGVTRGGKLEGTVGRSSQDAIGCEAAIS